ncbi:tetratricopeptide repeat protein [Sphingobacterium suaedae]|uniref:Tetratricopeptide repeat protein n=1 Tax=Sphingobacterium suaedae TaxID=1686402 RepID=A0ABW5KD41_9SPHI
MSLQNNRYFVLADSQLFPIVDVDNLPTLRDTTNHDVLEMAKRAYIAWKEGKDTEAIQLYSSAISSFPEQPFFYACRSILNQRVQDDEGAFYDYQVAKQLDFNYHVFLEWQENRPEETRPIHPYDSLQLLLHDALDATQSFDYRHAINLYSHGIDRFSGTADIYVYRGALYLRVLRYRAALDDFNDAIQLDPFHAPAFLSRGKLFEAIREEERAMSDFNEAVELNPDNSAVYEERGNFLINQKKFDAAVDDYSKLIKLLPDDFYVYALRADLYEKMENWLAALEDYSQAIERNPYYSDLYIYRAEMREKLGDSVGAAEDRRMFQEMETED